MGHFATKMTSTTLRSIEWNDEMRLALEMRKAGLTLAEIGAQMGMSTETVSRRIRAALTHNIKDLADAVRSVELEELERLEQIANDLVDTRYLKVSAGRVVFVGLKDENGQPIIDAKTGLPAEVPLTDKGPVNEAINTRLRIMDRKSKLLGLDKPVKVQVDQQTNPLADLTPAQLDEAMSRWLLQMNGRRGAATATDVVPQPLPDTPTPTPTPTDPILMGV